jgi:hypothetical protein
MVHWESPSVVFVAALELRPIELERGWRLFRPMVCRTKAYMRVELAV